MRVRTFFPVLWLVACASPTDLGAPLPRRLSPRFDIGSYGAFILGEPPEGPAIRALPVQEWPPYLLLRRPVVGVRTDSPDSLAGAWASLDEHGNVACFVAEYGPAFGYRSLRALFTQRFGPPTVDSSDVIGYFSIWIDPYTVLWVGAGRNSENRGGAMVSAFARTTRQDPRARGFAYPCSPAA
jgi:hypothetical protein